MGVFTFDASVLLLQGDDLLPFLDGLTTNKVDGPCTTVFTNLHAKIIDVCEVIPFNDQVVLVGFEASKSNLIEHLRVRFLGRNITLQDVSHLNQVYLSNKIVNAPEGSLHHTSFFGKMVICSTAKPVEVTWSENDFTEYRIQELLPFYGHEISSDVHPLACGLGALVHPQKGCYIGQEILTRMRSRNKMGKQLLRVENPVDDALTVGKTQSLVIRRV
ncbi:MAG: hypothetical protein L7S56_00530 [Candidatus Poseidonia sp.]|nr:hypothetical protein [Poseidonia sp.]